MFILFTGAFDDDCLKSWGGNPVVLMAVWLILELQSSGPYITLSGLLAAVRTAASRLSAVGGHLITGLLGRVPPLRALY